MSTRRTIQLIVSFKYTHYSYHYETNKVEAHGNIKYLSKKFHTEQGQDFHHKFVGERICADATDLYNGSYGRPRP
jgi:hypothetical protein